MRTLVVSTSYPRFSGDAGGHFVAAQVARFAARGEAVEVVAPGCAPQFEDRGPVRIHWAGGVRGFGWPGVESRFRTAPLPTLLGLAEGSVRITQVLERLTAKASPSDLRIVAHWLVPSVSPWLLRVSPALPVAGYAHGADVRFLRRLPAFLRTRWLRRILARARELHFASASLRDALLDAVTDSALRREFEHRACVTLPELAMPSARPGVAEREARRARIQARRGDLLVIALGRLVPDKGYRWAVDAVATMRSAHLVVVGDGPSRPHLERRARDLGARVTFLGQLDREEALAWLAAADVLVHPSLVEAAPTVVREARELGIPVVAAEAGDVASWAARDDGIRCVAADPRHIARELERFARVPA
ncbi:MAG: glycosyltransferase family 4 protein [Deltaproteobacteria bacterium]|nr:glycosyltransferase family 4 protein [Deltaproteobacteria bacterium]